MAFRFGKYHSSRIGNVDVTIKCGPVVATREKSVACMRGDRKIFIPRSFLKNPDASIGDEIGKIVISFALARKFRLLA